MNLRGVLVEKVSKAGNTYYCVELYLTETYKKIVFLDEAEIELLRLSHSKEK